MLNPDKVLTKTGAAEYRAHLFNVANGIFFILNHDSDLEIDEVDSEVLQAAKRIVESDRMKQGDSDG